MFMNIPSLAGSDVSIHYQTPSGSVYNYAQMHKVSQLPPSAATERCSYCKLRLPSYLPCDSAALTGEPAPVHATVCTCTSCCYDCALACTVLGSFSKLGPLAQTWRFAFGHSWGQQ